jgi:hypothetical protein
MQAMTWDGVSADILGNHAARCLCEGCGLGLGLRFGLWFSALTES